VTVYNDEGDVTYDVRAASPEDPHAKGALFFNTCGGEGGRGGGECGREEVVGEAGREEVSRAYVSL